MVNYVCININNNVGNGGVVLWLVNSYIPMDIKIKKILNAVVVIIVILWLLRVFGVLDSMSNIRVGIVNKANAEKSI